MPHKKRRMAFHLLLFIVYGTAGVIVTLLVAFTLVMNARQDLDIWHVADLDEEFTRRSTVSTFAEYLALEDRLFAQLDDLVYTKTGTVDADSSNRYKRGSLADPARWPRNWNRSYEMPVDAPQASVLLLHGLSDSPYSLRHMAERLHDADTHVLGLRIPGHGTAPSGLVGVTWKDMAAAVRLAVRHLADLHPNQPIYLVGYSNGAALAVHYALWTLEEPSYPAVDRLVLLSPEIGVTPAAAFAVWQARLGHMLGLEKLAWNDIVTEYDPFKYGSFAINAGDLSHRITCQIQGMLDEAAASGRLTAMPPIQAFSSVVDATVSVPALVERLFARLPDGGHELVLFGVNGAAGVDHLLRWSPTVMVDSLTRSGIENFTLTLLSNDQLPGAGVVERKWSQGGAGYQDTPLDLVWPDDVYSLTHVALPFPPGDELYGGKPEAPSPGIQLGSLALRGEPGVLNVSPEAMLRLRWNPFYPYLEKKALEFLDLE